MDGPRDDHTKSERERKIPYITYMWNLKYDTNGHNHETDSQRTDLWLPRGRWWGRLGLRTPSFHRKKKKKKRERERQVRKKGNNINIEA